MGPALNGKEKTMTATTKETTRQTRAPSHLIWFVPDRENAPWTRIGAQWPIKDGTGYRLALDMVPIGKGSIVALPYEAKADTGNPEAGA
jgi:hypothetical protein